MPQQPFAELIDLRYFEQGPGHSRCMVTIHEKHLNPNQVVHGAVTFSLADIGRHAVVQPTRGKGELCATMETKIYYVGPAHDAALVCTTTLIKRGKTLANLDASVRCAGMLLAKANGTSAIFRPSQPTS